VIGIDTCRENLHQVSRKALPNALYLIANAEALPEELSGLASHITVNFPWGSLLKGLLTGGSRVIGNLLMIAQPGATLAIVLNSSALQKEGLSLEQGGAMVQHALQMGGFDVHTPVTLDAEALRRYPTTWAKRLGYGRDPHALSICAICPECQEHFWKASVSGASR
jgi:16S rRNA (adenine(1408)-N(1))-methyltransferase